MEVALAFVVGGLTAAGMYMLARRSIVKLVIGLALIGNAANLLIFAAAGMTRGRPPLVPPGASSPPAPYADPTPQSLILTAIVIGFGVLAFALVLTYRTYQTIGTDDLDELGRTDA